MEDKARIVIIDYKVGNLLSIYNMLKRIGVYAEISSDPRTISDATKLILPGVGAFDYGMKSLADSGFTNILNRRVIQDKIKILGICLGMQLMTRRSDEGELPGLGWFDAQTERFPLEQMDNLKIPHMGWNEVHVLNNSKLMEGIQGDSRYYFVHSYKVRCANSSDIIGSTTYGIKFNSIIQKENIFGVQFHPEKSHKFGMKILENFCNLT